MSHDESGDGNGEHDGDALVAGTPVAVRRRAGLAALIGAAASAVAIAYLWRASHTLTPLDWSLCAFMSVLAAYYLASLVDARTPLAVADDLGVRIRLGDEWRGLPWDAIREVTVHPRRGVFRDGRIVFEPHSIARATAGLEGKAKRHAALNQRLYGAALAVPVGFMTRVSTSPDQSVVDQIAALSLGRAEVVDATPTPVLEQERKREKPRGEARRPAAEPVVVATETDSEQDSASDAEASHRPARRRMLGGIATIVSRVGKRSRLPLDGEPGDVPLEPEALVETLPGSGPERVGRAASLRTVRRAQRAEVTRDVPATMGNAALHEAVDDRDNRGDLPESRELRRPGSVDLVYEPAGGASASRVQPISRPGDPVEPLVVGDFVTEPAYDPVIGPDLHAARTRLGLSVDELADRTRIRPHVIESIEVDDFAPCGGDFYARGHLRTLARVLGKDPAPLVAAFDERYATAPVNARRVFEAELATGMRSNKRGVKGGPNWGLLIGVVLALILVWGVVRFFAAEPANLVQNPAPVLNGSAGLESDPDPARAVSAAKPLSLTLFAARAESRVVVRNGRGKIVFGDVLGLGEKERLQVSAPVRVQAANAGGIEISVEGADKGVLGVLGASGGRTFR